METVDRRGGFPIEEDLAHEAAQWRLERVTWAALLVIMAAAVAGAFGNGWLSHARAGEPGGPLWVEYERVGRYGASMRLIAHARPDADGVVRIALSDTLVRAFRVGDIVPAPASARARPGGVEYAFTSAQAGAIVFEVQPAERWSVDGAVAGSAGTVRFTQFILP